MTGEPVDETSPVVPFRPPASPDCSRLVPATGAVVLDMGVAVAVGAAIRLQRRGLGPGEPTGLLDRLSAYADAGDPVASLVLVRLQGRKG